jgi:hypothetical protein
MDLSGQFHAPAAYSQGKSHLYPLDRRLCGLQSRSERGGEEKNSRPLPRLEPPIIQPVAALYHWAIRSLHIKIYSRELFGQMSQELFLHVFH